MKIIDEQYTRTPFYGAPRMTLVLKKMGYPVSHGDCQASCRLGK